MNTTRISVIAAAASVVAWAAKGVAIGVAGGLGKSPLEGPFFLAGLICFVVAACSLALALVGSTEWWARTAAVAGAVLAVFVVTAVVSLTIDSLVPSDHWAWSEASLWLASTLLLGVTVRRAARSAAEPAPDPIPSLV